MATAVVAVLSGTVGEVMGWALGVSAMEATVSATEEVEEGGGATEEMEEGGVAMGDEVD